LQFNKTEIILMKLKSYITIYIYIGYLITTNVSQINIVLPAMDEGEHRYDLSPSICLETERKGSRGGARRCQPIFGA